jgi:hypothetical protein
MRRSDAVFLLLVGLFALLFAVVSLGQFGRVILEKSPAAAIGEGLGGKARDVDVEQIKRLLDRGVLSDREALYYKKSPDMPQRREAPSTTKP